MWPSGTEPLADQSFSTTPTQSFGMKRSVSHASNMNAAATLNIVSSRKEVNMEASDWGRYAMADKNVCPTYEPGLFASERRTPDALSSVDRGTRRDPPTSLGAALGLDSATVGGWSSEGARRGDVARRARFLPMAGSLCRCTMHPRGA